MNKKLLAIAVASALAAPMAANASDVTIYGKMHFGWDFADTNDAAGDASDDATGVSKASRLGFKGSEDLGDGMKAVYKIEGQVNGTFDTRNTYVGLAGGFGTLILGQHDTPYKISTGSLDNFGDTVGDYNGIVGRNMNGVDFDERVAQTVAYITPDFGGFHAAIARVSFKSNEGAGNDELDAWSAAGIYKNGPLFASLAWETHSGAGNRGATATQEEDAVKLGLGYSFGDGKIGFVYEDIDHDGAASASSRDAFYVNYTHKFGNNAFKIAYGSADDSDASTNDGADMIAVGIDHSFSKRTKIYGMYATMDNDASATYGLNGYGASGAGNDVDVFSMGIVHSF